MTATQSISSSAAQSQSSALGSSAASMDYGAFLKLLVAQLKNQDPSKPMDSTQYMSQLAQFSQLEQSISVNTKLDELLTSSAIEQANQLIGRTITSADGEISGKVVSVKITSDGLVAKLADGKELKVGQGVVIS
jgi:flagellar basal-body rod modification protein FlgD